MDTSAFIAPARISVLLVPIHPVKRSKFEQYANLIRGFSRIDLSDIPPDSRGERGESLGRLRAAVKMIGRCDELQRLPAIPVAWTDRCLQRAVALLAVVRGRATATKQAVEL